MNEKIFEALAALANKLGTTAEYLWAVLVKQAQIEATISALTLAAILAVLVIGNILWFKRAVPAVAKWDTDMPGPTFLWIGWGTGNIMLACFAATSIKTIVVALGNPEYWALSKIIGAL